MTNQQWLNSDDVEYSYTRKYVFGRGLNNSWHLIDTNTDKEFYKDYLDSEYSSVLYNTRDMLFNDLSEYRLPVEDKLKFWKLHKDEILEEFRIELNAYSEIIFNRCITDNLPFNDREEVKSVMRNYFYKNAVYFYEIMLSEFEERRRRKFDYQERAKNATTKKDKQLFSSMAGRYW